MSLIAKDSMDTSSLFGNAIKSIKLLDGAVNARPEDISIRLLRAKQSFRLPESFFKRTATTINDLELLLNKYENDKTILNKETYLDVLYLLGKAYLRLCMNGEADTILKKLLEEGKETDYYEKLNQELESKKAVEYKFDIYATDDQEKLFKEGIRLHNLAVSGVAEAAGKARDVLKIVYEKHKSNFLVEGYYGSSVALMGKFAPDSQSMFSSAIEGMKILNHAVENDNYNPKIRYLRGYLFYNLPEAFFHTGEKAAKDFRYVAAEYDTNPRILTEEKYWQMLFDLGVCYERINAKERAVKVWKKLLNITTNEKYKELLGGVF